MKKIKLNSDMILKLFVSIFLLFCCLFLYFHDSHIPIANFMEKIISVYSGIAAIMLLVQVTKEILIDCLDHS